MSNAVSQKTKPDIAPSALTARSLEPSASDGSGSLTQNKEFSKILDEKTKEQESSPNKNLKEELQARLTGEYRRQFSPLERLLYDLAYRDPATWSLADRQEYHLEKNETAAKRFIPEAEFSVKEADIKKSSIRFSNAAGDSTSSQTQNLAVGRLPIFSDIKTSLEEAAKSHRVNESQIIEELIRQIAIRKLNDGSEVRITLNPEALGEVKLQLFLHNDELTARFETENREASRLLNDHLDELNEALTLQGLTVKNLAVNERRNHHV